MFTDETLPLLRSWVGMCWQGGAVRLLVQSIIGTVLGAFVLTGIRSYLIVGGIDAQWYMLFLGFIVVAATFVNRLINSMVMRVARAR